MFKPKIILLEERIVLDAALGDVIFVDVNASGANNGSSWKNAYTDLQSALAEAASTPSDSELIKIADGVYKPGLMSSATYNIPDKTALVGGFGGTTILSGDIGVIGLNTDNINNIVTISAATVSFEKMTIEDGYNPSATTAFGAGMFASLGSHVTLNKMIFNENFSNFNGGGVAVKDAGSTLDVNKSIFTNNSARSSGGALYAENLTNLTISHSLFDSNSTITQGGALLTLNVTQINIEHTTFTNNFVSGTVNNARGGAVFILNTALSASLDLKVEHSLFENNRVFAPTAAPVGGAFFLDTNTTGPVDIAFDHNNFINNSAQVRGGALLVNSPLGTGPNWELSIDHSTFEGNTAGVGGGAIAFARRFPTDNLLGRVSIDHSDFIDNQATIGGAINDNAVKDLIITKSNFRDNSATSVGGALYINDIASVTLATLDTVRTVRILDSQFKDNSAPNGGAVALVDPGALSITLTVDGNQFNKNAASNLGGAYYQSGGISWVIDNHFNKNYDVNGDQVVIDLPASVNGYTTSADIINSLEEENKKLDDDEISVLP